MSIWSVRFVSRRPTFAVVAAGLCFASGSAPVQGAGVSASEVVSYVPGSAREDFRDFRLADARMSLDEQRLVQRHRQVHRRRRLTIGDVRLALHGVVEPSDLLSHARAVAKRALQCGQQK